MEIKSSLEDRVLKLNMLVVLITPKDRDSLVELLKSIPKKAKLDRLDEYMLNSLVSALENPEVPAQKEELPVEEIPEERPLRTEATDHIQFPEPTIQDKVRMVNEIKKRVDNDDKKSIQVFIKESVDFGQKQFGIKTVPKSNSVESFWDWLYENRIILIDGSPNPERK